MTSGQTSPTAVDCFSIAVLGKSFSRVFPTSSHSFLDSLCLLLLSSSRLKHDDSFWCDYLCVSGKPLAQSEGWFSLCWLLKVGVHHRGWDVFILGEAEAGITAMFVFGCCEEPEVWESDGLFPRTIVIFEISVVKQMSFSLLLYYFTQSWNDGLSFKNIE